MREGEGREGGRARGRERESEREEMRKEEEGKLVVAKTQLFLILVAP